MEKPKHNRKGNCWDIRLTCPNCDDDTICDVCHEHDQLRYECSECPECPACAVVECDIEE